MQLAKQKQVEKQRAQELEIMRMEREKFLQDKQDQNGEAREEEEEEKLLYYDNK